MAYTRINWEQEPSPNTPVNASNLNIMGEGIYNNSIAIEQNTLDIEQNTSRLDDEEIYVTATAGSNGDFHCTLSNPTLTPGRAIKIAFPEATDGSEPARLSVNGVSGDYTNCKMGNIDIVADELQDRMLEMIYDGTDFGFKGSIRGSNSNGNWTKFSDGTMICRLLGPALNYGQGGGGLHWSETATWTFPKPFTSNPTMCSNVSSSATSWATFVRYFSTSSTSVGYRLGAGASWSGTDPQLNGCAIGKWY